tara:strand:- start:162 stop:596 length:435 start_codon:yes stop_codon:yes gene_type:complete
MNKFLIIFFFFIISCGPVEEINFSTPSGKPEVLVQNSNIKKIKSQIINDFLAKGGRVEKDTDFSLSILVENDNFWGQVLLGTPASGYKNFERVDFNFAEVETGIKVFAQYFFVTGYGTSNEQADQMNSNSSLNQLQDYLRTLKY